MREEEKLALVKLHGFFYMKPSWIWRLLELYKSAQNVLRQKSADLFSEAGLPIDAAKKFLKNSENYDAEGEMKKAGAAGARIVFAADREYPELLREIYDPPAILYVKGNLTEDPRAAVVGARKPSQYGFRNCVRIIVEMSSFNVVIASGMARGIDSAAHETALKCGMKTCAVLGSGIDVCYPRENWKLYDRICSGGGAVISELPAGSPPLAAHFPRRNRIISGVSGAVFVVEGTRSSGSLITARFAVEQGRDLFALPGNVDSPLSEGPNNLIKQGAFLCRSGLDILSSLPLENITPARKESGVQPREKPRLTGISEKIFNLINESPFGATSDEIIRRLRVSTSDASMSLFELEAGGHVYKSEGKYRVL